MRVFGVKPGLPNLLTPCPTSRHPDLTTLDAARMYGSLAKILPGHAKPVLDHAMAREGRVYSTSPMSMLQTVLDVNCLIRFIRSYSTL